MYFEKSREVWKEFGHEIVMGARRQLGTRKIGKNKRYGDASGTLRRSLTFRLSGSTLTFFANPPADKYANFINYGVNGTEVDRGAPYTMKRQPPSDAIMKWMKVKPVRLRNEKKEFIKQTPSRMKSAAFLIARAIKKKGIVGMFYFQRSYDKLVPDWEQKIADAMAYDLAQDLFDRMGGDEIQQDT